MTHGIVPPFRRVTTEQRIAIFLGAGILLFMVALLAGWMSGWMWTEVDALRVNEELASLGDTSRTPEEKLAAVDRLLIKKPLNSDLHTVRAALCLLLAKQSKTPEIYRTEARLSQENAWQTFLLSKQMKAKDHAIFKNLDVCTQRLHYADFMIAAGGGEAAMQAYHELLEHGKAIHDSAFKARLWNNAAYAMLTGPEATRDAARALELIKKCIKVHPASPTEALFLDTLAVAYWKNGQLDLAESVMRKALAQASRDDLPVLLEHFDAITTARGASLP